MEAKKATSKVTRNPSLKRKPPVVKQTKGSLLRMIKANPLIAIDDKTKQELGITDAELKQLGHIGIVQRTMSLNPNHITQSNETTTNGVPKNRVNKSKMLYNNKPNNLTGDKKELNLPKRPNKCAKSYEAKPNVNFNTSRGPSLLKKQQTLRRSVSADRFDNKKDFPMPQAHHTLRTCSVENVITEPGVKNVNVTSSSKMKSFTFKTPQTYRNVFTIPSSNKKFDNKSFFSSTPADVKARLNNWLSKRGKSLGSYHHLKCFGIPREELEEEKENIEEPGPVLSESYESLHIIPEGQESKEGVSTPKRNPLIINYDNVAKDALHDLLRLIQEGYPSDQCSEWLNVIRNKCNNIEDEPTYWECRAALEECYENLPNAIICYRTAIIKGAEVKSVDGSLDLLLKKFSLLNIDSNINEKECNKKTKIIMDARNVFKSTIIQFAVHERENKKRENKSVVDKELYVTPVRRSSRLSFHQRSVPGVKLCSSLKEVGEPNNFSFKKNNFLSVRYN